METTTPVRSKSSYSATTPTTARVSTSHILQSSPHYATTRRHSLYGVEDRVVVDPGSRIWKVGFSGEGRPRDVFFASGSPGTALWSLQRATDPVERAEQDRLLELKLQTCIRSIFHEYALVYSGSFLKLNFNSSLLTDPKARKVILAEHPLLPIYVKDMIARILFENLQVLRRTLLWPGLTVFQVPSVSFASSHLLSLFAVGKITGLVLDCGHLESVVLPVRVVLISASLWIHNYFF